MEHRNVSRRTLLKGGGAALAALQVAGPRTPSPASPIRRSTARGIKTSRTRRSRWDSPATSSSRGSTSPLPFRFRTVPGANWCGRNSTRG